MNNNQEVIINLKNPYGNDYSMRSSLSISVAQLKQKISEEHPDKPPVERQRLIFSGRTMLDSDLLSSIIRSDQIDLSIPQNVHLMIRQDTQNQRINVPQTQAQPQWGGGGPFTPNISQNPYQAAYGQQFNNFGQNPYGFQPLPQYHAPPGVYGQQWGPYPGNVPNGFPQQGLYPGQYQGMGMAMGVGGQYMAPQVHRVGFARINIDFYLIFKLLFLVYVLGQGGGSDRTALLVALAIAFYLYQAGIARFIRVAPNAPQNVQQAQAPPAPAPAPGNVQGNDAQGNAPEFEQRENGGQNNNQQNNRNDIVYNTPGIIGEILGFFVPLVCSLVPSWQPPENTQFRRQQPDPGQEENVNRH